MTKTLTAIIERDGRDYVAMCLALDIASQRTTVSEAYDNLTEALELFFECASPEEMAERLRSEVYVTNVEIAVE